MTEEPLMGICPHCGKKINLEELYSKAVEEIRKKRREEYSEQIGHTSEALKQKKE
jgi:uncharacterized Zn finger protein (UPF0148 family)